MITKGTIIRQWQGHRRQHSWNILIIHNNNNIIIFGPNVSPRRRRRRQVPSLPWTIPVGMKKVAVVLYSIYILERGIQCKHNNIGYFFFFKKETLDFQTRIYTDINSNINKICIRFKSKLNFKLIAATVL